MKRYSKKERTNQKEYVKSSTRGLGQQLQQYVKGGLREFVISAGMTALQGIFEEERTELCGVRYQRGSSRTGYRYGSTPSELVLGGRKVRVNRPRVRSVDNDEELGLPSFESFCQQDPLSARVYEQMLIGVSTRKYGRSLEPLDQAVSERGTSKSAVSRRFIEITEQKVSQWLKRDLSELKLLALMIDGIAISEHMMIAALGIDEAGNKHVLGIWEGATEHSSVCIALLTDLRDRGLVIDNSVLVVLDGSKALGKAVITVYGKQALIQRCQVHKVRNIVSHLPKPMQRRIEALMWEAYRCGSYEKAKKSLDNVYKMLEDHYPGAAASLKEGLDETLTVLKLGLPVKLVRMLGNTNMIESFFSQARQTMHRVKRYKNGKMVVRWTATAIIDIASRFRKIRNHELLATLKIALQKRNQNVSVDSCKNAA